MGKKKNSKRVKENLAGNKNPDPNEDSPSSSTSTLTAPMDPQVVNNDQEIYMDDLPPEMLIEILKCLDTSSLCNLRLVNKKWNEISSGILQKRPEKYLWFRCTGSERFLTNDNRPLKDFLDCMKDCTKICPIARFIVFIPALEKPEEFFQHPDWLGFISDFSDSSSENPNQNQSKKMKSLELIFDPFEDEDNNISFEFGILFEQLKDLLLNKLPNLEEFILKFSREFPDSEICFFPAATTTSTKPMKMTITKTPVPVEFQFPQLKTIRLYGSTFSRFPGITRDLLTGAVNLKKICLLGVPFDYSTLTIDVYNLLRSLGKLELLNNAEIVLDEDFLPQFQKSEKANPNPFQGFKLEEIGINNNFIDKHSRNWTDATNFLSNILESNKDTLKTLGIRPCGFLHNSETNHSICFPEFKNLTDLVLGPAYGFRCRHDMPQHPFFPRGIRSMDVFPAVNSLSLGIKKWTAAFPQDDSIPRLPRLRNLDIEEDCVTEFAISKLALLCPNLKNLRISKRRTEPPQLNLLNVVRSIWTEMQQLESLELNVDVDLPHSNSTALDSCFTGISVENCQSLYKITEARKTLQECLLRMNIHVDIPESELTKKRVREHPSILDMKDLRKLTIHPFSGKKILAKKEFSNKLTWISQEYAFMLMPQLKLNEED